MDDVAAVVATMEAPPIIVAASDSSMASKHAADIRCSGFADDKKIQKAIDQGGSIHMTGGTFSFNQGGIYLKGPGQHHIVGCRINTNSSNGIRMAAGL